MAVNAGTVPATARDGFVSLDCLAATLRLPRSWLRAEALARRIPCVRIGRRLLFDVEAVRAAVIHPNGATQPIVDEKSDAARWRAAELEAWAERVEAEHVHKARKEPSHAIDVQADTGGRREQPER